MIGFLRGKLVAKQPPVLLIDVNGVGYEVEAPTSTWARLPELGQEVRLRTHLVIREDQHLLFGFATDSERRAFRQLVARTGVFGNILMFRTAPGNAHALAVVLDAPRWPEIMGTVAGDDTVFALMANARQGRRLLKRTSDAWPRMLAVKRGRNPGVRWSDCVSCRFCAQLAGRLWSALTKGR